MIEQTAVVVQIDGQFALVEAQRESSCGQCSAQKGCGTGVLAKSIGQRVMRVKVLNQCNAQPGDEVIVGMPEKGFIKSALITYLLPLLLMLFGAIIAQQIALFNAWVAHDGVTLMGAFAGFALALLLLRRFSKKLARDPSAQPVVLRKSVPQIVVTVSPPETGHHKF